MQGRYLKDTGQYAQAIYEATGQRVKAWRGAKPPAGVSRTLRQAQATAMASQPPKRPRLAELCAASGASKAAVGRLLAGLQRQGLLLPEAAADLGLEGGGEGPSAPQKNRSAAIWGICLWCVQISMLCDPRAPVPPKVQAAPDGSHASLAAGLHAVWAPLAARRGGPGLRHALAASDAPPGRRQLPWLRRRLGFVPRPRGTRACPDLR